MKYIKCDRCGVQIEPLDNQSDVTVMTNFDIPVSNFKTMVDLCEKCTKQFYTHFMNNHYCYEGVTMFEKEAEELIEESKRLNTTPRETVYKAVELGYNKANEWHYVKDGDYPKDNKPVLCILGDIDSDNCEVGYYNDVGSGEPWHFETYHLPDDDGDNACGVYAWKEIVLPKESE